MKALGMIEVYGYLTAVEALDSALKAANVSLTDVVRVRGGLVTVLINGETGAVKAAMDAAAAAAERVGTVVSVHVIPRPADDVARMLSGVAQPEVSVPEAIPSDREEQLQQMVVVELRRRAREIDNIGMTRQEIRFARKQDLIRAILKSMRQEK